MSFQEREDPMRESRDVELVAPQEEYIEKADSAVPQVRPPAVKMQVVTSEEQEAVTTGDQGRLERYVAMNIAIDKVPIGSLSEGRPVRPERSREDLWPDMKEPGPSVPVTFQPPMRSDHAQAEPTYETEKTYVPLVKEAVRQRKTEPLKFPVDAAVGQAEMVAPAIRVTIGRVDVRAVISQVPAPQEKTTPAPAMTLEEYLKRRSRGGR
jgi:hypothetical protein